jgi:hypothetical protein
MKIALIPPKGYELYALEGSAIMSLCLPSYMSSFAWAGTIRQAGLMSDMWHILDNGAAEGEMADVETLLNYGQTLHVDEIVVPDVLGDCNASIELADKFFRDAPKGFTYFNWMGVLQGKTEEEMLKIALHHVRNESIRTLGIPRNYITWAGALSARTDLANEIDRRFPGRFQIHFLGVHPAYPGEIRIAAKYTKVRSLDTSLPFNATIVGTELDDRTRMIERPEHYFSDHRNLDRDLLQKNIRTVKEWASGKRASTSTPAS